MILNFQIYKLGNSSKYDRRKPEKGQAHLCKHLRRATNVVNVKAKISMPCSSTRHSVSSQSEKHTLFHINVAKIYAFLRHQGLKNHTLWAAHISDRLSRGVISPLPHLPAFQSKKHLKRVIFYGSSLEPFNKL